MKKRKSVLHWWSILADNYGWLWKNNLLYLLCIAPSVICGFLFFLFHAYLFLMIAAVGLVLAGPGILAVQKAALDTALEKHRNIRTSFRGLYRKYFRIGCRFGLVLMTGIILIGKPVYFALSINSPMFPVLLCFSGMWLLLWFCSSSQVLSCLCADEKTTFPEILKNIFAPGAAGIMFGLSKFVWVYLCGFVPTLAVALALLGIPIFSQYSILYYMCNQGDKDE